MPVKQYNLNDGVTQSILTAWDTCPVLAKNILEGWMSPTPNEALFFGSLFHNLLEDHYTKCKPDEIINLDNFLKEQQKKAKGIKGEIIEKSFAMAEALYEPYVQFWDKADSTKNWQALEPVFDVEGPLTDLRLRGRIDGVFKTKTGDLWLLETKTKSRVDEAGLMEQLNLDFQNLFYINAAEIIFKQPIKGVLYNVIRKPQLRQKNGEDLSSFARRMEEDVVKRPEFYFIRYEISYTRRAVKEFKEELTCMLEEFIYWLSALPRNPARKRRVSCTARWNCEFLSACSQNSMAGYIQKRKLFSELD